MRGRFLLCGLAVLAPCMALAQTPQPKSKKDSVARADSIAKADSIALVAQLTKELGGTSADSSGAGASGPVATGGYMNIGFVSLTDAGWSTSRWRRWRRSAPALRS